MGWLSAWVSNLAIYARSAVLVRLGHVLTEMLFPLPITVVV